MNGQKLTYCNLVVSEYANDKSKKSGHSQLNNATNNLYVRNFPTPEFDDADLIVFY